MEQHKSPQHFKLIDNYIINIQDSLGEGQFGKVFQGIDKKNGQQVAIKQVSLQQFNSQSSEKTLTQLQNEILTMQKLKSPNIVQLIDVKKSSNNVYMIIEFCNGGSLDKYLKKNQNKLSEKESIQITKQIVEGFKCLYANNVVHRDLKPANILLHEGEAKIADFGFAKMIPNNIKQAQLQSLVGSPLYMCPQILSGESYTYKSDIWSLGVIFFEMLYGVTPYQSSSIYELIEKIKCTEYKFPSQPQISPRVQQVISLMLKKDENERIGWEQLFKCDIFFEKKQESLRESIQNINLYFKGDNLKKSKAINNEYFERNRVLNSAYECIKQREDVRTITLDPKKNPHDEEPPNKIQNQSQQQQQRQQQQQQQSKQQSDPSQQQPNVQQNVSIMQNQSNATIPSNPNENYNQAFETLKVEQQQQTVILQICDWILHKRNKAVFINGIAQILYDINETQIVTLDKSLYYRVLFLLSKYQMMIIYKIHTRLKMKRLEKYVKHTKDQWKLFIQSKEKVSLSEFIQNDLHVINMFFNELLNNAKGFFINYIASDKISPEQKQQVEEVLQVCDNQLVEKTIFDQLFLKNLKEIFEVLVVQIKQIKLDPSQLTQILQITMHIYNAVNMKNFLRYDMKVKFDFQKYYEEINQLNNQQLQNKILNLKL